MEYVCDLCDVSSATNVCEMCGSDIIIVPTKGNQEMMNKLRQPLCLFQINKEGRVNCNTEIIERIRERFDPSKKLVVLVAAGLVGTGKSTWMNALLYKFCGQQNNYATFNIGYTAETETEGLWVFPHPLTLNEFPDVQFMIMDMEGMNGIKACTLYKEQVEISLRKIFMVGMIVASVFTLHTQYRVDSSSLDLLQNTFKILVEHRKQLGVEFPRIMILVKDSTEVKVKSPNGDLKSLLRSYGQFDKTLDDALEVYPKPTPPIEWTSADQHPNRYTALEKSEYQQFNHTFLKRISEFCKRKPALTTFINIEEFCQLLQGLSGSINDAHFADYFKGSIEHTISSIVQPLLDKHIEDFEQQSMQLVSTLPSDTSLVVFNDAIQALTKQVHQSFFSAVREKLNVGEESEYLKYAKAQLVIRTKSYLLENLFVMRQKNSSQIEKIKLDNEAQQAKAENALKNLNEKMRVAKLEQEEQVKKSQELIIQMQRENEEALQRVKMEFSQKLEDIEQFYNKERDIVDKRYDDKKKILMEKKQIEEQKGDTDLASQLQLQLVKLKEDTDNIRAELQEEMEHAQVSVSELNFNNGLGHYQKDNYILAKQHFESAASLGCGQAYYYLGVMYLNGEGVKKDMVEAGNLFLKSIELSKDPKDACQQYQLLVEQGIVSPRTMPDTFTQTFNDDEEEKLAVHEKTRDRADSEGTEMENIEKSTRKSTRLPLNMLKPWKLLKDISTAFKSLWSVVIPLTPAQSVPTIATEVKSLSCKLVVLSLQNFGLQKARQIVTACEEYLQLFVEKKMPNPHNLTNDEIFAIICYTYDIGKSDGKAEDNIYFQLNHHLRQMQNSALKDAWNNYLFYFQAALAKIPSETTVVFRGIGATSVSVGLKNYRMHRRVQWSAFTSASRRIDYAKDFAKKDGAILRLSVSTGKSIAAYSYITAEDEVIISPNMTFLVVKDLYRHVNYRYIDFVQEEPSSTFVF